MLVLAISQHMIKVFALITDTIHRLILFGRERAYIITITGYVREGTWHKIKKRYR